MGKETVEVIQATGTIISVIISVTALFIAYRVEVRNNKRFQTQLELTTKIAHANIKPLLGTYTAEFINQKAITLHNYGNGTAVINSISFSKNQKVTKNIAFLFDLGNIVWDNYWTFLPTKTYLKAGDKIVLVKLSVDNLGSAGISETKALKILKVWQEQLEGVQVNIYYEDILGNKQTDYERIYKS